MVAQRMGTYNGGVPTDGLSPTPGFTAETMQASWTKFRSLPAERALPGLREICENAVTEAGGMINGVDVSGACPVLDDYGASATLTDKGGWLFQEWFERAPNGQADFWVHPWTATEPVYTPNTLNTSLQASKEALAAAVSSMQARGIPLDASIGEVQRAPQPGAAPLPGCLEGDGCYAAIGSFFPTPTSKQAEVTGGTSIVMFTELQAGHDPLSKALLAYSQSEDPTSPYYERPDPAVLQKRMDHASVDAGVGHRRRDHSDASPEIRQTGAAARGESAPGRCAAGGSDTFRPLSFGS